MEAGEYILQFRFDETELPGLRRTIGYMDSSTVDFATLAALITTKLGPRIRERHFPPEPDALFDALDATTDEEKEAVRSVAHGFMLSLGRMTEEERWLLGTIFAVGCPSEMPENGGIAQPTAIDIVRCLESAGHIRAVGEERQTRPGPRAVLYGLVTGRQFVASANVRDRKITAALGDIAGGPAIESVSRSVDGRPLPAQIADAIEQPRAQAGIPLASVSRTVIGVPGIVDPSTGDLGFSCDLPRLEGKLLGPLREEVPTPVRLFNGVQLAAFAEDHCVDLRRRRTFALVWVGAGSDLA